jgi:cytochrome b
MTKKTIKIWDAPTRIFHWSLLTLMVLAWITSEADGALFWTHLAVGYGVLFLIAFRFSWGVLGSRHARFSDFVHSWPAVRDYVARFLNRNPPHVAGHNPLGGWMIVLLLTASLALVATGLFAGDDDEAGPWAFAAGPWLADGLGEVHEGLNAVLWGLVVVHVAGVAAHMLLTGENLIRAMWTGKKTVPPATASTPGPTAGEEMAGIPPVAPWRFALALVFAAGVVWIALGWPLP